MKLAEFGMIACGVPKQKCGKCGQLKICKGGYCIECFCVIRGIKIETR